MYSVFRAGAQSAGRLSASTAALFILIPEDGDSRPHRVQRLSMVPPDAFLLSVI
jgi:hypothetical protein